MTNADKIRSMTDDQLAEFIDLLIHSPCIYCKYSDGNGCNGLCASALIDWLKQEHEDESKTD